MKSVLFIILVLLQACSSGGGYVRIKTVPEQANALLVNGQSIKELGKTPLRLSSDEFFQGQSFQKLVLTLPGHKQKTVVLTKPYFESTIDLNFEFEDEINLSEHDVIKKQEKLAKSLAIAQNFIQNKDYNEAINVLNQLKIEYYYVSVVHDFLGNISYLRGNRSQALAHYMKAQELNPENLTRKDVISRIQSEVAPIQRIQ